MSAKCLKCGEGLGTGNGHVCAPRGHAYDSLVESLLLAKKQRDQFEVERNKLEAELARYKAALEKILELNSLDATMNAHAVARQALDGGKVADKEQE